MFNGSKIKLALSTGLTLAGLGIASFVAVPAYAGNSTVGTANVNSKITFSGVNPTFALTGDPLTTATTTSAVTMNVRTNNKTGYNVTVQAGAANMVGTGTNADVIPVSAMSVRNTATGGAYTALSNTAAVTVATTAVKSTGAGDTINNDYQIAIPWVNADSYSVTLNYIAANNP